MPQEPHREAMIDPKAYYDQRYARGYMQGFEEWAVNWLRGGLEPSFYGFGRFTTKEAGHVRCLNDAQPRSLFAHFGPKDWKVNLSMLDWYLFRTLPNAATMVATDEKR